MIHLIILDFNRKTDSRLEFFENLGLLHKILCKMRPLSTEGTILILAFSVLFGNVIGIWYSQRQLQFVI